MTNSECVDDYKAYIYDDACLTPVQCEAKGVHAYKIVKMCTSFPPAKKGGFDETQKKKYIYDCKGNYLDITGSEAKCVSYKGCSGIIHVRGLCIR